MNLATFEQTIFQNWADHFACPEATLAEAGTTIVLEEKYAGNKLLVLWHFGPHTVAQLDPAYADALSQLTNTLPAGTALTSDAVQQAWGGAAIKARSTGFAHYLFPADLPPFAPPAPYGLRALTPADAEHMAALHAANSPADVEEAYVDVSHEIAFGCFVGDQLVAASSGYRRAGFLDIGVLTRPECRRRGLGKAVVGALCEWAIAHDIIAQYRHDAVNTGSAQVARSLNFRLYFRQDSVELH